MHAALTDARERRVVRIGASAKRRCAASVVSRLASSPFHRFCRDVHPFHLQEPIHYDRTCIQRGRKANTARRRFSTTEHAALAPEDRMP